ncbi:hypothetical protein UlMin_009174 [Ulmus minor]
MAIASCKKVDTILGDLAQGVFFSSDNVKAFCYKVKKMVEEAKKAYKEALKVEPELVVAREVLHRLYFEMKSLGTKLQNFFAFALDHVKGFIFIEAIKQLMLVPKIDVYHLLSARSKYNEVSASMWARVKNGKYKGDLAQVLGILWRPGFLTAY